MQQPWFIIDFDSTFTQVEAMEELAAISLKNDPEKEAIIEQIKHLTDLAMDGKMPFNKSLKARIALLSAKKYHINMLVNKLRKKVSPSFARNKEFFKKYQGRVLIVSGGFKEFIAPVVKSFFIEEDCIYANTFIYDKKNNIIGSDEENPLAQEGGKVKLLKQLKLKGQVIAIGDGYTDYQMRESGMAEQFFAFTENIARERVLAKADYIAPSLDEILYKMKLPMALSYPKSRINAVLLGKETFASEPYFKLEGYNVIKRESLTNKAIVDLNNASILVSSLNQEISNLNTFTKLICLAVWGTNNHQFNASIAQQMAVPIFSSPFANTRSVVELGLGFIFQLSRQSKSELRGKKIGIIGYGNAGSLMGVLAQNLGMDVLYFDEKDRAPLGNAMACKSVIDLLKKSNYVVLLQSKNAGTILAERELKQMQPNACLINLSYDNSVSVQTAVKLVQQKKLLGFAMDFQQEENYLKIKQNSQIITTLHQRNSTVETQQNIASFTSEKIIQYINTGNLSRSLNFPDIQLPALQGSHRFIHIHKNKPGLLAKINAVLAKHKINITGQYLKTNETLGYVITDVAKKYDNEVISELKKIDATIKFRVIY
ncbi:MAG: HAD-IB family phosphatase [Candidatus Methylacidiphilales bacterium]